MERQETDDVWESDSPHGPPCAELERETRHRMEILYNNGFREGMDEGKEILAQEGFDEGFKDGMEAGLEWGAARGVVATLKALQETSDDGGKKEKINSLVSKVDIQESVAATSIFNSLVDRYNANNPSDVLASKRPSESSTNVGETATEVMREISIFGYVVDST